MGNRGFAELDLSVAGPRRKVRDHLAVGRSRAGETRRPDARRGDRIGDETGRRRAAGLLCEGRRRESERGQRAAALHRLVSGFGSRDRIDGQRAAIQERLEFVLRQGDEIQRDIHLHPHEFLCRDLDIKFRASDRAWGRVDTSIDGVARCPELA